MEIVFISDTHGLHRNMKHEMPEADLIVAAGDVTGWGSRDELADFLIWMNEYAPEGIIVAGNHDRCFEVHPKQCREMCEDHGVYYLEDESVEIDGIHFYGSPWTPKFGEWHFMYERNSDFAEHTWSLIPKDVDVLITHGPPHGVLDQTKYGLYPHSGCEVLARHLRRVNPPYHFFGHIHEANGFVLHRDTGTMYYNVAICDERYRPVNEPILLPLEGR